MPSGLLGLRTSWLSREILVFSLFAALAAAFAGSFFVPRVPASMRAILGATAATTGALGVLCSVMVYAATRRRHWRGPVTGLKFALSTLILGTATVVMVSLFSSASGSAAPAFVAAGPYCLLTFLLMGAGGLMLAFELSPAASRVASNPSTRGRAAHERGIWTFHPSGRGVALGRPGLPHRSRAGGRRRVGRRAVPDSCPCGTVGCGFFLCLIGDVLDRYLSSPRSVSKMSVGGGGAPRSARSRVICFARTRTAARDSGSIRAASGSPVPARLQPIRHQWVGVLLDRYA